MLTSPFLPILVGYLSLVVLVWYSPYLGSEHPIPTSSLPLYFMVILFSFWGGYPGRCWVDIPPHSLRCSCALVGWVCPFLGLSFTFALGYSLNLSTFAAVAFDRAANISLLSPFFPPSTSHHISPVKSFSHVTFPLSLALWYSHAFSSFSSGPLALILTFSHWFCYSVVFTLGWGVLFLHIPW